MKSVFISHSGQDKEYARKIAADLSAKGIKVWLDSVEIKVGDSLVQKISQGISESDFMLVLISENSVQSKWVQIELEIASTKEINSGTNYLLPAVIGTPEIPNFLQNRLYVNLEENYEEGINKIIETVKTSVNDNPEKIGSVLEINDFAKEVAKEVAKMLKVSPSGIRLNESQSSEIDEKLVFVIISFRPEMDSIFEGIKAAGDSYGLRVERVKDVEGDYRITNKIIELINKAFLIVADLTHERPNVYFELGYARGLEKNIITTAKEGTEIHFDVKDWTYTTYNDSRVLERKLKSRFAFELGINE